MNNQDEDGFLIPSVVLSTACTVINASEPMTFFWSDPLQSNEFYIYMYFAELEKLQANQSRLFKIYLNDDLWFSESLDLPYLKVNLAYVTQPLTTSGNSSSQNGTYSFKLVMSQGSTLPPILNAIEIFKAINFMQSPTDQDEGNGICCFHLSPYIHTHNFINPIFFLFGMCTADAIMSIKLIYGVERVSWQGDPCAPKEFVWWGLGCTYNGFKPPRITTL